MKRELVTGLLTLSLLASMLPANAQAAEGMFGASAAGQVMLKNPEVCCMPLS